MEVHDLRHVRETRIGESPDSVLGTSGIYFERSEECCEQVLSRAQKINHAKQYFA